MQRVFVLDANHQPLTPCRPARARILLSQQRAAVFRRAPCTIILHAARPDAVVTPLRLKIDPGSLTTGLAVLSDATGAVVPELLTTAGVHVGIISMRAKGSCDVTTNHRRVGGISIRYCRQLQHVDGYGYATGSQALPPLAEAGSLRA